MAGDLLNAGELDREITIQQLAESIGTSGFPIETWSTLATVWASKNDVTGRQRFAAAQVSDPFDTEFQIYYRSDMDPELLDVPKSRRVLYQGRRYDIVFARQLERQQGIALNCLSTGEVVAT